MRRFFHERRSHGISGPVSKIVNGSYLIKERRKGSKERTSFAVRCLPEEYELYERIDLNKDKKAAVLILIWTALMAIGMIVPMLFKHPLLNMSELSAFELISGIMATAAALIVYVFLHEGVHRILIRLFTGEAPSFGLELRKGIAYAGSSWYFRKTPYIAIALAPLAVWTIVIGLLLMDIDESYPRVYKGTHGLIATGAHVLMGDGSTNIRLP